MTPTEAIAALGLTYSAEFVPFSKSRNAKANPKINELGLNWRVTVRKGARSLTTDYGAGIAHIPGYKYQARMSVDEADAIRTACELGTTRELGAPSLPRQAPIPAPKFADVLHCLVSDSEVIDCATFEEWASDLGYDPDSLTAERVYKACLEIALKLRAMVGDTGLAQLRDAFQDY